MSIHDIERLALEAWAQDLSMVELMARLVMGALERDMIEAILGKKFPNNGCSLPGAPSRQIAERCAAQWNSD